MFTVSSIAYKAQSSHEKLARKVFLRKTRKIINVEHKILQKKIYIYSVVQKRK